MNDGEKPPVLVVDDQVALRTLISRFLARAGFDPIEAADGAEAIKLFKAHAPLAVVSDIMMPNMDGLALLAEIKRIDGSTPVVLMTGLGTEEVLLRALRGGASNFYRKPFPVGELVAEVRRLVQFKIEARRGALYSPFLVREEKTFELAAWDASYAPIVNQIALQLPSLMSEAEALNLKVGIEEMIANAIEHGTLGITFAEKNVAIEQGTFAELLRQRAQADGAVGKKVTIVSRLTPECFEIVIRDEGMGFDWRSLPEVAPENLFSFNGRGIFLTKIYFDEVMYNERGNEVTLRKRKRERGL